MKNLRIGDKLVLGFTCCIILSAIIGGVAVISLTKISSDIKKIKITSNIEKVILECRRQEKNILLLGPHTNDAQLEQGEKTYLEKLNDNLLELRDYLAATGDEKIAVEAATLDNYRLWLNEIVAKYDEQEEIAIKLTAIIEKLQGRRYLRGQVSAKTFQTTLLNHRLVYHSGEYMLSLKNKITALKKSVRDKKTAKLTDEYLALFDRFAGNSRIINTNILNMRKSGRSIQAAAVNLEETAENKIAITHRLTIALVWITFLSVAVLTGIICVLLARNITRPVGQLAAAAAVVAQGDLSQRVDTGSRDEIGQLARAFNHMAENLQKTTVSKNYVDNIIDSMLDALLVVDMDSRISAVNGAACRILGGTEADLLGKPVREIFAKESFYSGSQLNELLEIGYVKNRELVCLSRSGARIAMLFSGAVMRGARGQITGIVGVGKDMRELIKLQEKLAQHEKLAVMGEFAGIIGHEFKNQLGVMRVSVYFLKMKSSPEDEKQIKHLNILEKQIIETDRMIENILTFGRTRKPEFNSIDIRKLIMAGLEKLPIPKAVIVDNRIEENLPGLRGDEIQLSRVMVNMFLNAIQAMAGKGTLSIKAFREHEFVNVQIADTGSGISAENKARLFEPFFSTKSNGTGLGLASSRYIVEAHGGSIAVESEIGKGTVMTVKLPLKPEMS